MVLTLEVVSGSPGSPDKLQIAGALSKSRVEPELLHVWSTQLVLLLLTQDHTLRALGKGAEQNGGVGSRKSWKRDLGFTG